MNEAASFLVFVAWPVCTAGLLYLCAKFGKARLANLIWLRLIAGNGLVFLFLSSLVFLGIESYYRFVYNTTESFGCTRTTKRWNARYVRQNNLGFRDDVNYEPHLPADKRRVCFLGDSFTVGHGVRNVENRFANRIRQANPQWDVMAAALPGWDTSDEALALIKLGERGFELDQIVLVYCLNDISDIVPEWPGVLRRIRADEQHENWLLRNSYFINTLYYHVKARRDPDMANYYHFAVAAYRGPLWEEQKKRLLTIERLARSNGRRLLVVTFPFLHAPLDDSYEYRFVHYQLAEFWRQNRIPHLDLLPVYQGYRPRQLTVNLYDAHPNEFAHRLAARAIETFLRENLASVRTASE